jgi:hypothetical protein
MAHIGVSITKSTPFRNSVQEFSNVYYYEDPAGELPDATEAGQIIDDLTAFEKSIHSSGVTFVRGRLWSNTGSKATSEMILQKNLTGLGTNGGLVSGMDKERAYLFRLRAGTDSRGNPVYLRKWYHTCGNAPGGTVPGSSVLNNTAGFTPAERTTQAAAIPSIDDVGGGVDAWELEAKSYRKPSSGAQWEAHQFLEHHQMGDMWRAQ